MKGIGNFAIVGGSLTLSLGIFVYPAPILVTVNVVIRPLSREAVDSALVNPTDDGAWIVTEGGLFLVYPEPAVSILIEIILPLTTLALAVAVIKGAATVISGGVIELYPDPPPPVPVCFWFR